MPSDAEQLARLKELVGPDWLTEKDVEAIQWAVERLAELEGALRSLPHQELAEARSSLIAARMRAVEGLVRESAKEKL